MAGAICLEGKTLWLDVGLHCKGRVSPPGEGRFEVGTLCPYSADRKSVV